MFYVVSFLVLKLSIKQQGTHVHYFIGSFINDVMFLSLYSKTGRGDKKYVATFIDNPIHLAKGVLSRVGVESVLYCAFSLFNVT